MPSINEQISRPVVTVRSIFRPPPAGSKVNPTPGLVEITVHGRSGEGTATRLVDLDAAMQLAELIEDAVLDTQRAERDYRAAEGLPGIDDLPKGEDS